MPRVDEIPAPEGRLFCVYCGGNVTRVEQRDHPQAQEILRFQCNNPKCAAHFFGSQANPILGLQGPEAETVQKVAAGIVYELYFRQMAAQASEQQPDGEPTASQPASPPEPDGPDVPLDESTGLVTGFIRLAGYFFDLAGKSPKRMSWFGKVRFTIKTLVLITLAAFLRIIGSNVKGILAAIFFGVPFAFGFVAMLAAFVLAVRASPFPEAHRYMYWCTGISLVWISVGAFFVERGSRRKAVRMALIETSAIGFLSWLIFFGFIAWVSLDPSSHISLGETFKKSWILDLLAGAFLVVLILAFLLRSERASAPK